LDISPGSSDWRTLTAASFKYGLTTGTYKTDRLTLTNLAARIVSPTSDEDRIAALFTAALNPPTFRSIFDYFKAKKLPATNFLEEHHHSRVRRTEGARGRLRFHLHHEREAHRSDSHNEDRPVARRRTDWNLTGFARRH
jgi:hypothetical protein